MVPKRSIVALGASGSGKTVFLASMASKLAVQSKDIGFFLSVPLEEKLLLAKKFEEIAYKTEWPLGTREISEWQFTCRVFAWNSQTFPTFEFTYLDYAGGILTDITEDLEKAKELEKKAASADALLAIIDGHKLYAEMDDSVNAPPGSLWLDLNNFISTMAQQGSTPIHFVISKWDLLDGKYSLGEVRARLMEFESFADLVELRADRDTPIRLIPVSSVGMDFAELKDGVMRKIPDSVPKPFQVEMPIAHVVLDEMKTHLKELEEWERKIREKENDEPTQNSLLLILQKIAEAIQRQVPRDYNWIAKPILTEVIKFLEDVRIADRDEKIRKLQEERDKALKEVENEQTATDAAMKSFMYLMEKLSRDFPESDLSKQ